MGNHPSTTTGSDVLNAQAVNPRTIHWMLGSTPAGRHPSRNRRYLSPCGCCRRPIPTTPSIQVRGLGAPPLTSRHVGSVRTAHPRCTQALLPSRHLSDKTNLPRPTAATPDSAGSSFSRSIDTPALAQVSGATLGSLEPTRAQPSTPS